jgi:hypothetical protein
MVNPPPTGLQPLTSSKDMAASGRPGRRVGNLPAPLARPAPAPNPQCCVPTPPTGGTSLLSGPQQSPCLGSWPTKPPPPMTPGSWQTKPPRPTAQQSPPSGGAARSQGAVPSRAMGGSPPSVRVSSFSPTNRGFPPLASCPLARCPSPAHSPAADETKVADDPTYINSVEEAPLVIFDKSNVLLNEGDAPTNGAPPLLLAQASISSVNKGTDDDSAAPRPAVSLNDLATVVARVKALESLLVACLTTLEQSPGNHAAPTDLATLDARISELESLLSAHATLSSHVWVVEQRILLLDSSIMSI